MKLIKYYVSKKIKIKFYKNINIYLRVLIVVV